MSLLPRRRMMMYTESQKPKLVFVRDSVLSSAILYYRTDRFILCASDGEVPFPTYGPIAYPIKVGEDIERVTVITNGGLRFSINVCSLVEGKYNIILDSGWTYSGETVNIGFGNNRYVVINFNTSIDSAETVGIEVYLNDEKIL